MHSKIGRRAGALVIATAAAAAFAAAPASAAPTSCGSLIEDAAGDGFVYPAPRLGDLKEEAPQMDIREAFFTVRDGALQAHIKVEDLKPVSDDVYFPTWEILYTAGDTSYRTNARFIAGEWSFQNWVITDDVSEATDATGSVVEGPGGTITIDIPADFIAGFTPGMTFTDVTADTIYDAPFGAPVHAYSDRAPDDGAAVTLDASVCGAAAPAPQEAVAVTTKVEETAAQASTDAAPVTNDAPAPAAAPAPAPVTAAPATVARTAKKAATKKTCVKTKAKSKKRKAAACKVAKKKTKAKKRR